MGDGFSDTDDALSNVEITEKENIFRRIAFFLRKTEGIPVSNGL